MIEILAPAKINLGLGVIAPRDDGFHDIDTLMVTIDICDRLQLVPLEAPTVEGGELQPIDMFVAAHAPAVDSDNLAVRAAYAFLEAAGWPGGVRVLLGKAIPVAAGLGGGSSDAGAVLRGLERLYGNAVDPGDVAALLGSDVPFFAMGIPAARARGRGERLEPLTLPAGHLVLVNPGVQIAAKQAYDWRRKESSVDLDAVLADLMTGRRPALANDLQPGVVARVPEVGAVLDSLRAAGLDGLMSGSGATCFGIAADRATARSAAATLKKSRPDWWVRVARFPFEP